MFKRLLITVLLIIPLVSAAQQNTLQADSLLTALETATGKQSVNILLELSEIKIYEEEGLNYATKALEEAKKINDPQAIAESLNAIGKYYVNDYQEKEALKYFFRALDIVEQHDDFDRKVKGKTLRNIGKTYFYIDSIQKATDYNQKVLLLAQDSEDRMLEADALLDYGSIMQKKGEVDSALVYMQQALKIRKDEKAMLDVAKAYSLIGRFYFDNGNYHQAILAHQKEIAIKDSLHDPGLSIAYYNVGRIQRTLGNYQLALEKYQKSLTLFEQLEDSLRIAYVSMEIGNVYENLSRSTLTIKENEANYNKALEFHQTALSIFRSQNDLKQIALSLNNIANCYSKLATNQFVEQYGEYWEDSLFEQQIPVNVIQSTFGQTFDYYNQALELYEKIENEVEVSKVNINLGSHYIYTRNWESARKHLNIGLNIAKELNRSYETSLALFHIGEMNFRRKNYDTAEQNFIRSLKLSSKLGIKDVMMYTHNRLSRLYEIKGLLAKSLKHTKTFILLKDEIFSEESQKAITEMQTKYETEKKEQEIKLLNNEKALQKSVIQRQRLTIAISIGGIIVILAFAGLLINMVRQKQRANRILEEKNELISHQKQEITDSIRYASRIQNAILPSATMLKESLKEHFVLFLPRDIVSGDFYWFTKKQNKMVLVAADCTGHGVPGAFMSMLGVSFLYEIVNKEGIMEPARILNTLRDFIKLTLSQTGKKDEQKDGMDISLCMLDTENMKLEWAGAYNPLVLIRNNEIIEYKADKMPVAIHITDHQPFTNHEIDLMPNDRFYMYSDGFPDQFGGTDGRKYMSKRFKQLLLDIHQKPMDEQKEILHQEHLKWRGETDQIDDIVIFGVRV